jgi:hypothetical protein
VSVEAEANADAGTAADATADRDTYSGADAGTAADATADRGSGAGASTAADAEASNIVIGIAAKKIFVAHTQLLGCLKLIKVRTRVNRTANTMHDGAPAISLHARSHAKNLGESGEIEVASRCAQASLPRYVKWIEEKFEGKHLRFT